MPEGDTIFRTADTLRRAIGGATLAGVSSDAPGVDGASLVGQRVEQVEARGKHLLIHLGDGRVLHTHLGMKGAWHVYRPGDRWRKRASGARLILETDAFVAVCFNASIVEILTAGSARRDPVLSRLGPDLLSPELDVGVARERLRACGDLTIAEALLTQTAVAGIGNVYKCEVLFLCGVHPQTPVLALARDEIDRLVSKAVELMSANLRGYPRVTRHSLDHGRHWVYGRRGRPCRRCGATVRKDTVRKDRWGPAARATYWCPVCQGPKPARKNT